MKRTGLVLLLLLPACAHLGPSGKGEAERRRLWDQAHAALAMPAFARADSLFSRLAREHPESEEGRESIFYLGAMRIDPRNPSWDPQPAEAHLRRYLAADSLGDERIHRRPEAETIFELARQLNLPAGERLPALQPETRVETRVVQPRRIVRSSESQALATQVEELRRQLAAREAEIRRQEEELERIRKTLTGRRPK